MTHNVPYDQRNAGSGQRDHVIPASPYPHGGTGRQVPGCDIHRRLRGQSLRKEAALQRERGRTFTGIATGIVDGHCRPGGKFIGKDEIILLERLRPPVTSNGDHAHSGTTGTQRHVHHRMEPAPANRGGPVGIRGDPGSQLGVGDVVKRGPAGRQGAGRRRVVRIDLHLPRLDHDVGTAIND